MPYGGDLVPGACGRYIEKRRDWRLKKKEENWPSITKDEGQPEGEGEKDCDGDLRGEPKFLVQECIIGVSPQNGGGRGDSRGGDRKVTYLKDSE